MNKSKFIVCILGILIGLALVYVGFTVQDCSYYLVSTSAIGQPNDFEEDFKDEMYGVTQDVGHAVNDTTRAVSTNTQALMDICKAIGWLIVALGATDAVFFTYKLTEQFKSRPKAKAEEK